MNFLPSELIISSYSSPRSDFTKREAIAAVSTVKNPTTAGRG
jgi:hypothetical protein